MTRRPVTSLLRLVLAIALALSVAPHRALGALRIREALAPMVAGAASAGEATLVVRRLRKGLSGTLTVAEFNGYFAFGTFVIMTYTGSPVGNFTTINLPSGCSPNPIAGQYQIVCTGSIPPPASTRSSTVPAQHSNSSDMR